ncbi:glycosyltransferase family 4 protein [Nodosilinea sp. PGN35]|uniref:glycosyltransferase family 4 protein n=1 Tax=Nodosilinea sp. PGN35 TaxID=3020489 RepID=UPI0023B2F870|nr:glycosyltransferase family 4 protein [Nodosilinea sp. TSF1-S3]MDF0367503.1 glycosyltransferase family 4 protein [Nodosilinea sp. TSF1-S3]
MRIAYFTGTYPRATDTFIQREVTGLRDLGLEVFTFAVRRPADDSIVGPEQIAERSQTNYLLPFNLGLMVKAHLTLLFGAPSRYVQGLKLAWATSQPGFKGFLYQLIYFVEAGILAHLITTQNIAHLHNHIASSSCTVAMLAAELGGFTFSFTMHGPHIFFEPYRWRVDEKIKHAKFVACISHFCRSQGMIFSRPDQWDKLKIVHCGVDPSLFETVTHQGPGKRLLYVGRLAAEKGLPVLLEALPELIDLEPELILTVVGDGADRALLEQQVSALGLQNHVRFLGYQSQSAVREHLKNTDIFVLPSFAEGIPVVLMEAMAAGVAVIATQVAGVSELVHSGINGYGVPPGDRQALSECISFLMKDADTRNRLGAAARTRVEQEFNVLTEVEKLYQLFTGETCGRADAAVDADTSAVV